MKAKDLLKENRPPSILLYGPPGTGKTGLVSQIGSSGYLFDYDRGMRTALTLKDKFTEHRQAVEFGEYVDDSVSSPSAYLKSKTKLMELQGLATRNQLPYTAIAIDSLTGLCRAIQQYVMSCAGNALAPPQIQHWGQIVNEVESILTIIRSFKILVIVTAHEMYIETETGNMLRPMSATQKHSANKLTWLFDEVLYTKIRRKPQNKVDYIVTAEPSAFSVVRTRSGLGCETVINDEGLEGLLKKMSYNIVRKGV